MPMHARLRLRLRLALVLGALALASPARSEPPRLPALNEKVDEFVHAHLGQKVGDGQCLSLAIDALRHAGAKPAALDDPKGDYAWGRLIDAPRNALPGDILQFRDAEFQGKRWVTKQRWVSWHYSYPHHTAIVSKVSEGGNVLTILHQNVGADDRRKQLVQEGTLRMDSLQKGGWVRIYRPVEE